MSKAVIENQTGLTFPWLHELSVILQHQAAFSQDPPVPEMFSYQVSESHYASEIFEFECFFL